MAQAQLTAIFLSIKKTKGDKAARDWYDRMQARGAAPKAKKHLRGSHRGYVHKPANSRSRARNARKPPVNAPNTPRAPFGGHQAPPFTRHTGP